MVETETWNKQLICTCWHRVGRKYTFLGITFVMATAMTASAFTQDFVTFAVLRFVCGITSNGFFLVLFVWGKFPVEN